MTLGDRILAALRAVTTDPALVEKVDTISASDEAQTLLLDTLGTTTTQLASDIAALRESLDESDSLDDEQTEKLDAITATLDSLNAAFPDAEQAPAEPVE